MYRNQTYILVDNRRYFCSSFVDDAAFSSYLLQISRLLGRYFACTKEHAWINLAGLGTAASYRSVKIVGERYLDLQTIAAELESTHQCTNAIVAGESWEQYLTDGVHKIISMLRGSGQVQTLQGRVVIYTTTFHLFGGSDVDPFTMTDEGFIETKISEFCSAVLKLQALAPLLKVEIVSVDLQSSQGITTSAGANAKQTLFVFLKTKLGAGIDFSSLGNSPLYYDEELRRLMSIQAPTLHAMLPFPAVEGRHILCHIDLCSVTVTAADALHRGDHDWTTITLFSLCPRTKIDPLLIEGCGLLVQAAARGRFPSDGSHRDNALTFASLSQLLAEKDCVVILRIKSKVGTDEEKQGERQHSSVSSMSLSHSTPHPHPTATASGGASGGGSGSASANASATCQYWALVPPAYARPDSASAPRRRGLAELPHMVVLRLADRDGVLVAPSSEELPTGLAVDATEDAFAMQVGGWGVTVVGGWWVTVVGGWVGGG